MSYEDLWVIELNGIWVIKKEEGFELNLEHL